MLPGEHNSLITQFISIIVFISVWEVSFTIFHTSHGTVTKNDNMVGIYLFILTKFIGQIFLCFYVPHRLLLCSHKQATSPVLNHYKPAHFFTPYFSKVLYNIYFFPSDFLPKRFMTNILYALLIFYRHDAYYYYFFMYSYNQAGYVCFLLNNVLLHSTLNYSTLYSNRLH